MFLDFIPPQTYQSYIEIHLSIANSSIIFKVYSPDLREHLSGVNSLLSFQLSPFMVFFTIFQKSSKREIARGIERTSSIAF